MINPTPVLFRRKSASYGGSGKSVVWLSVVALMASVLPLRAAKDFGRPGDYLRYGAGARPLAMGGAFTGLADDATAEYWNPAALAFLEEHQFTTMYAPFGLSTNLYYAALGLPLGPRGAIAASDLMLHSDGFQTRNDLNLVSGDGSILHNAASLSGAVNFQETWSVGARARFLQQKIIDTAGDALALDLAFYSRPIAGVSGGVMLSNVNRPKLTLDQEADAFGRDTRVGLAYHGRKERFLVAVDWDKPEAQKAFYTAGLEINPIPLLSLRTGWNQDSAVTAGFGLTFRHMKFDYAFSNNSDLGAYNKVSLTWRWQNIYHARLEPEGIVKETNAVFLAGLRNEVKFHTGVPPYHIHRWSLVLVNEEGKTVRVLTQEFRPPERILWDVTDEGGKPVKRGEYRYTFRVEYKNGKTWTETGRFKLDFKSGGVPTSNFG
jgi:hypothetical protein